MNEYNYWMVERLAEQRRAEMAAVAEAERLARLVDGDRGRPHRAGQVHLRLAYAAAVVAFLLVVAQMLATAGPGF
jgi:hypothetical protein